MEGPAWRDAALGKPGPEGSARRGSDCQGSMAPRFTLGTGTPDAPLQPLYGLREGSSGSRARAIYPTQGVSSVTSTAPP